MKIILNRCFGGFGLSDKATRAIAKLQGFDQLYAYKDEYHPSRKVLVNEGDKEHFFISYFTKPIPKHLLAVDYKNEEYKKFTDEFYYTPEGKRDEDREFRTDTNLISVVEQLGKEANGICAQLEVVELPDSCHYHIEEYDGSESITYSMTELKFL